MSRASAGLSQIIMIDFEYHRPKTLSEAFRLKEELPNARFIAGGTDVMVRVREGKMRPGALVSLTRVPELAGIRHGDEIKIGALTRVSEVLRDPEIAKNVPVLALAAQTLGSAQIRNLATVGGNLCNASPCADMAPPLLVLDATVTVLSPRGERTLSLADFFVAPGEARIGSDEIVSCVCFWRPGAGTSATFIKKSRVKMDISIASIAARLDLDGKRVKLARLAAGSVGPRPMRLPGVEALLTGQELSDALLDRARAAAEQEVKPISDVRASEEYRRHISGVLARRALARLGGLEVMS
jgi:aerobic carbon-monoxide dehydrogenase medium subunit